MHFLSRTGCLVLLLMFGGPAQAQTEEGKAMQTPQESATKVMTVLEAHVEEGNWNTLRETWESVGAAIPPQIVESFLVQGTSDPTLWRIVTVWRSRDALAQYKESTETPGGVLMFRAAGAEPTLLVFQVAEHTHEK